LGGNNPRAGAQPNSLCPDLVARVFQMKVKAFPKEVTKIGWFAKVIGNIWTKEY
jgi:hypothetical protein